MPKLLLLIKIVKDKGIYFLTLKFRHKHCSKNAMQNEYCKNETIISRKSLQKCNEKRMHSRKYIKIIKNSNKFSFFRGIKNFFLFLRLKIRVGILFAVYISETQNAYVYNLFL
ncbi:hypothetical protein HMPREF3033_00137 [Veillonellaceae bacterium DNF00751]|nr:hypothetical protein HMPREF3033_00137 [Veillonellaceae bacterium DNF00751]